MERLLLPTELMLQQMRTVAISGAGLGVAILLGILQVERIDQSLLAAVYATAIAIPTWVAAWQYVQVFLVNGDASYGRFKVRTAASIGFVAGTALAVALGAVIWHFSPCASAIFALSCLFSVLFIKAAQ